MSFSDALQSAFPPGLQSLGYQTFEDDASPIAIGQTEVVTVVLRMIFLACQAVVLALVIATGISLVVSIRGMTAQSDSATTVLAFATAFAAIVVGSAGVFVQRIANEARAHFELAEQHLLRLRGVDAAN